MADSNTTLVIMSATQLAEITRKLQQLEWRAAGYERIKAVCAQQKGRIAELENRVASSDETSLHYWTLIQNARAEVRDLTQKLAIYRNVDREYAAIERQSEVQQEENARLRTAADALEKRVALQEQQLEAADKRIKELEAALVLANLSQDSRDNVIQMVRAA